MAADRTPDIYLLPSTGNAVLLPDGMVLGKCVFSRQRDDLVLNAEDGTRVVMRHFYLGRTAPQLHDSGGEVLTGDLARLLAGLSTSAVRALMKRRPRRSERSA